MPRTPSSSLRRAASWSMGSVGRSWTKGVLGVLGVLGVFGVRGREASGALTREGEAQMSDSVSWVVSSAMARVG